MGIHFLFSTNNKFPGKVFHPDDRRYKKRKILCECRTNVFIFKKKFYSLMFIDSVKKTKRSFYQLYFVLAFPLKAEVNEISNYIIFL